MMKWIASASVLVATVASGAPARLDVYPPDVRLHSGRAWQRFIVVATRPDGITEDVTGRAKATPADGKLIRLAGSTVFPLADGRSSFRVECDGRSAVVPVVVKGGDGRAAGQLSA